MIDERVNIVEQKIDDDVIIVGTFKNYSLKKEELHNIFKMIKEAIPNKPIILVPEEISVRTMTIDNLIIFRDTLSEMIDNYLNNKETE